MYRAVVVLIIQLSIFPVSSFAQSIQSPKLTNSLNKSAVITKFLNNASDNLLVNGDFSHGDASWKFSVITPAQATGLVVNGEYVASITNGGSESWHIQLAQAGFVLKNSVK
ncbi:hypothetical protein JW960_24920 [candidate division KSB1 bacterium]|nr:hypothetical protein [candidate division KSB1 bacterium]